MKFLHVLLFCIAFDFDEVPLLELRLVAIVSYASNVAKRPSKNWYVFSKILKKKDQNQSTEDTKSQILHNYWIKHIH